MQKILILSLSIFLLASCKPSKEDVARIAKNKRKAIIERIEKFTDQEYPDYTRNYAESYVNTNDSLVYMGVFAVENEKELVKIKYWATFENPYNSQKFAIQHKGTAYVMKN